MQAKPYFHLVFRPNIKLVSTVRRFTADFYRRVLVDTELSDRLALATHELLENAVAYSVDNETSIRIEIDGELLVITTWNRTSYERAAQVRTAIEEMNNTDPDSYYQQTMIKTSKRTDGSGLGLARIRAEADMNISCVIEERDRVCIKASAPIVGGLNP
ncbi:MAG: hypothetical protein JWO36_3052 [Myxococcales bacterium]|nr:hypothetical protein [Myxococcales bacterium]